MKRILLALAAIASLSLTLSPLSAQAHGYRGWDDYRYRERHRSYPIPIPIPLPIPMPIPGPGPGYPYPEPGYQYPPCNAWQTVVWFRGRQVVADWDPYRHGYFVYDRYYGRYILVARYPNGCY